MIHELKETIEELTRRREGAEKIYKSEIEYIDLQLNAISASLTETLSLLGIAAPKKRIGLLGRFLEYLSQAVRLVRQNGKTVLFYLVIVPVLLYGLYCISKQDFPNPDKNTPEVLLTMTQTERDLLRSAAKLVNRDIDGYDSVGEAISALYAESPVSVRDAVIERLGGVRSLEDFPKALEDVLDRVVVIDGVPHASFIPDAFIFVDVLVHKFSSRPEQIMFRLRHCQEYRRCVFVGIRKILFREAVQTVEQDRNNDKVEKHCFDVLSDPLHCLGKIPNETFQQPDAFFGSRNSQKRKRLRE